MAKPSNLSKGLGGKSKKKSSGSKKSSKKKIRSTHIDHHDDGSHSISHMFDQGGPDDMPTQPQSHGVSDASGLLQHMQDQFGGQLPPAAEGPAAGGGGAPAPGGM